MEANTEANTKADSGVKTVIDTGMFKKMFLSGCAMLDANKEKVNELNVFPVPDGDTGTNMTMTIMSAAREIKSLPKDASLTAVCKAMSSGSLHGARGNSGVILSQLLRGFYKAVKEEEAKKTEASNSTDREGIIDISTLALGTQKAVETAYKAVMKPQEGTILTVAREISEKAAELAAQGEKNLETFMEKLVAQGEETLSRTPEMLPVLKQAGVVDSGGEGLMVILKGALSAFRGKEIDLSIPDGKKDKMMTAQKGQNLQYRAEAEITFGYCTEFIILLEKPMSSKKEKDLKSFLETMGDSMVLVADDDLVKVHVHTNDPGLVLQKALSHGQLSRIKIDNMRLEHQETLFRMAGEEITELDVGDIRDGVSGTTFAELGGASASQGSAQNSEKASAHQPSFENAEEASEKPHKDVGFVAVSAGEGLAGIFQDLGCDYVIRGGQTMNPSTEDMENAIAQVNADHIFIFPNNSNIIMAAQQAKNLEKEKTIHVIPTKTIPQGISSMIAYMADLSPEENEAAMLDAIKAVSTGQVTYAVRDTVLGDFQIHQDDYMGIGDAGIISAGAEKLQVTLDMVEGMVKDSSELISVYYGKDVDEEEAAKVSELISSKYPGLDVDVQNGGQPIYCYIISVE